MSDVDGAEREARAARRRSRWRGGVAKLAEMDQVDDDFWGAVTLPSDFADLSAEFATAARVGGVDFEAALGRRVEMHAGALIIPVVGLADLSSMKQAADRDQDRADVKRLERRRQGSK